MRIRGITWLGVVVLISLGVGCAVIPTTPKTHKIVLVTSEPSDAEVYFLNRTTYKISSIKEGWNYQGNTPLEVKYWYRGDVRNWKAKIKISLEDEGYEPIIKTFPFPTPPDKIHVKLIKNFPQAIPTTQTDITSPVIKITPPPDEKPIPLSGKYHALIIGNNNYKYLPRLETPQNDAQEVARILGQRYDFKTELLIDASRSEISNALNKYTKMLREDDNFLIYYAGHGIFDKTGQKAYWLPIDARSDNDTNWIIVDDITTKIKRIASKHILVVADSCFSGTMTRGISIKVGSNRYLQKMLNKSSRTLLASGGNEPVSDVGGEGHSVFAEALIQGLVDMEPKAFTAEQLYYEYIKERVAGSAEQTPEYSIIRNSGHKGGDFVFRKVDY